MSRRFTIPLIVVLLSTAFWAGLRMSSSTRPVAGPRNLLVTRSPNATPARLVTIEVGGMTCAGCVDKIQGELSRVPGVKRVEVSLGRRRAAVLCDGSIADTTLVAAVRRAGPQYLGLILDP